MPVSGVKVVKQEEKVWDILPNDVYQAEVLDIELKEEKKWNSEEIINKLVFTFVVVEEGEFYGRRLWQYATPKLTKFKGGSNLYKVLSGIAGRQLTDEECASPEDTCSDEALNALIGKQVRLTVGQKEKKNGELKNIIDGFMPVKTALPAFVPKEKTEGAEKPTKVTKPKDQEEVDLDFNE